MTTSKVNLNFYPSDHLACKDRKFFRTHSCQGQMAVQWVVVTPNMEKFPPPFQKATGWGSWKNSRVISYWDLKCFAPSPLKVCACSRWHITMMGEHFCVLIFTSNNALSVCTVTLECVPVSSCFVRQMINMYKGMCVCVCAQMLFVTACCHICYCCSEREPLKPQWFTWWKWDVRRLPDRAGRAILRDVSFRLQR